MTPKRAIISKSLISVKPLRYMATLECDHAEKIDGRQRKETFCFACERLMREREPGYYWLRGSDGQWFPGEWNGKWHLFSGLRGFFDAEFAEIGPRIVHPTAPAGSASPGVTVKLTAERDNAIDLLMSIAGRLELPRSESGPPDDISIYEKAIDQLEQLHTDEHERRIKAEKALFAHPTVKVSGDAEPDEYFRDDPMFNKGVLHCQDLLGQVLGNPEYYAADGSEDYDTDLSDTLVNMLAAAGCYDRDECKLAQVGSEVSGDVAEMRERAAQEAHAVASAHAHHALWVGIIEYGWDEATEKFGRELAATIAAAVKRSVLALDISKGGQ